MRLGVVGALHFKFNHFEFVLLKDFDQISLLLLLLVLLYVIGTNSLFLAHSLFDIGCILELLRLGAIVVRVG